MKITALAGGVGGAKLLVGLDRLLPAGAVHAIVNTGDDTMMYGVHVSPDVDIVTYWLAGLADTERGWGIRGDTFEVVGALRRLGVPAWFGLGDRDLATCLARTERLRGGASLSAVTDEVRRSLGVATSILPMSDDPVRTIVHTADGRRLEFQEYFVRERHEPEVARIELAGIEDAKPAPGVVDALVGADMVVVCPSNPVVSIAPILALPGVRDALRSHPLVVAITPIIRGAALKGPADRMLAAAGAGSSASAVAALYRDFCDLFVLDVSDAGEIPRVEAHGVRALALDTVMQDEAASVRLVAALLEAAPA